MTRFLHKMLRNLAHTTGMKRNGFFQQATSGCLLGKAIFGFYAVPILGLRQIGNHVWKFRRTNLSRLETLSSARQKFTLAKNAQIELQNVQRIRWPNMRKRFEINLSLSYESHLIFRTFQSNDSHEKPHLAT